MRKLLSLFLALALVVMPAASMAASGTEMIAQAQEAGRAIRTDVTFTAGTIPADEQTAAIIADMLNALSFTVISDQPEEEGVVSFAMGLSGTEVLTVAGQAQGEDTYLATSLLDNTVAYNQQELAEISKRLYTLVGQSNNMSQAEIDAMIAQMTGGAEQPAAEAFALDEAALAEVMERIMASAKEEPVTAATKDHDAATTQCTVTLTAEDMIDIHQIVFDALKSNAAFMNGMDMLLAGLEPGMTAEEFFQQAPGQIEEMLAKYEDVACVLLLNEAGDVVRMTMTLVPKAEAAAEEDLQTAEVTYNRLTTTDGVGNSVALTLTKEAGSLIFDLNMLTESEKHVYFALTASMQQPDGEVEELFHAVMDGTKDYADDAAHTAGTIEFAVMEDGESMGLVVDLTVDTAKAGDDVQMTGAFQFSLLGEEEPMFTVNVSVATCDKPADIVTDAAVRPGTMDDEAFATFLTEAQASAYTNVMVVVQNLPMSVLSLMFGGN